VARRTGAEPASLGLAAVLPVTGDEAYFVIWGRNPALGYYDHPPMIGWWLAALLPWGDHPLWIRMPTLLVSLVPGLLLYLLFRREDPERARLLGLLGLFLPLFTIGPISSTDTPLILFSLLSVVERHYDPPGWLPIRRCAFLERYVQD